MNRPPYTLLEFYALQQGAAYAVKYIEIALGAPNILDLAAYLTLLHIAYEVEARRPEPDADSLARDLAERMTALAERFEKGAPPR